MAGAAGGRRAALMGGASDLLPITARIAFLDNSWGAQAANIDVLVWAWLAMGCRGWPTRGMRQARGGDSLKHLRDRIALGQAVKAGLYYIMNTENSLGDYGADSTGAGDSMLAELNGAINSLRPHLAKNGKIVVPTQPNSNTALTKPLMTARYNAGIPVARDVLKFDEAAYVDLQSAGQSSDGKHPTTRTSSKAVGDALGAFFANLFERKGVFDDNGGVHPLRIGSFNAATAWTVTANSSGLNVSQSQDTLDSNGRACRKFVITGNQGVVETDSGSTGDLRIRLSYPITSGLSTNGIVTALLATLEVSDGSGGAPVNLATLSVSSGQNTSFSKIYTTAHAGYWTEKFQGVFGVMPGVISGQVTSQNIDITLRGVYDAGNTKPVTVTIKIGDLNLVNCDGEAYGPPTTMSGFFTNGDGTSRPIFAANPTVTPSTTVANGATISLLAMPAIIGGGLTYSYDAIRDAVANSNTSTGAAGTGMVNGTWDATANGGTDVGDFTAATSGGSAVPYTTVAGDAGHTIALRVNASNIYGSTTALSGNVSVT